MERPDFTTTLSREAWDLHRQGPIDEARQRQRVKEAIKDNLGEIISEEAIIASDGNTIVKVPVRNMQLPRFRFDEDKQQHTGEGEGDSKVGDKLGSAGNKQKSGNQKQAGDQPGYDYYEADVTIDDIAEVLFAELQLPNLKPKNTHELVSEKVEVRDVRKKGLMANLDKRRTILENIKRNAIAGDPRFGNLTDEDLRFKTWDQVVKEESRAAVIAMRDVSGSMGEFEKYVSRTFYFWMVRFLRHKYDNVEIVFLVHHTDAREVDEATFFYLGESGGTRVSSVYKLALDIIDSRFPPDSWNIYPFHFSDGDNWGDTDNKLCVNLIGQQLLPRSNMVGYGEISQKGSWSSRLMGAFSEITDPRFVKEHISDRAEIYPALKRFFHKEMEGMILNV